MGVWKVGDAEDPRRGEPVFTVANTANGLIALAMPGGSQQFNESEAVAVVFVTPETAERIRIHLSAAINEATGERSTS